MNTVSSEGRSIISTNDRTHSLEAPRALPTEVQLLDLCRECIGLKNDIQCFLNTPVDPENYLKQQEALSQLYFRFKEQLNDLSCTLENKNAISLRKTLSYNRDPDIRSLYNLAVNRGMCKKYLKRIEEQIVYFALNGKVTQDEYENSLWLGDQSALHNINNALQLTDDWLIYFCDVIMGIIANVFQGKSGELAMRRRMLYKNLRKLVRHHPELNINPLDIRRDLPWEAFRTTYERISSVLSLSLADRAKMILTELRQH